MRLLDNLLGRDEIDRLERDVRRLESEPWSEKGGAGAGRRQRRTEPGSSLGEAPARGNAGDRRPLNPRSVTFHGWIGTYGRVGTCR